MPDTTPVSRRLLRPLWWALGASALFLGVATLQGMVRDAYDPWHQAVSALSLGPEGWVQMLNFVVFGAIVAGTAPVWRRILAGGRGATAYPALTATLGLSLIAVGVIPQDPAPGYDPMGLALTAPTGLGLLHLAIAGVAAACTVAGLLVMATRFAGHSHWRGWSAYSIAMAGIVVVSVAIYGVWSTRASGFAGTFERVAIVVPLIWTFTFLRRLAAGTPFLVTLPHDESDAAPKQAARAAPFTSDASAEHAP